MLKLRKNKKGFTLVELIVVIAIMAVLAGTIAGVTVSQLNKQTNNTAKSEAQTLVSDLHSFMIDYKLSAPADTNEGTWAAGEKIDSIPMLAHAVQDFIDENNQNGKIKVIALADNATPPEKNDNITAAVYGNENYKAGDHQFYAVVYKKTTTVGEGDEATTTTTYCVRFCCSQKGNGKNQFPFADYTYGEVLAD